MVSSTRSVVEAIPKQSLGMRKKWWVAAKLLNAIKLRDI